MGSIADKLSYLAGTKTAIKEAIEGKGIAVPSGTTFREYAGLIGTVKSAPTLQEKTVTPSAKQQIIIPDEGYDGLSKVTVKGDGNLIPENIKDGVSIFGVVGSNTVGTELIQTICIIGKLPKKSYSDLVIVQSASAIVGEYDYQIE